MQDRGYLVCKLLIKFDYEAIWSRALAVMQRLQRNAKEYLPILKKYWKKLSALWTSLKAAHSTTTFWPAVNWHGAEHTHLLFHTEVRWLSKGRDSQTQATTCLPLWQHKEKIYVTDTDVKHLTYSDSPSCTHRWLWLLLSNRDNTFWVTKGGFKIPLNLRVQSHCWSWD